MSSTPAVAVNAVSTVVGNLLAKGYFNTNSPFLPQSISIFGEANAANQSGLDVDNPATLTSLKQAGTLYGYGSPIYTAARQLFPASGAAVPIPVYVYPQAEAGGAVAKVITITTTGTASANGTIYLKINGRKILDGGSYAVNIEAGDTPTVISGKMRATVAAVLGAPVIGTGTTTAIFTTKWKGLTANDVNIVVDTNGTTTGSTFAVVDTTAGAGTPTVTASLTLIGNSWNTILVNTYGFVDTTVEEFEAWNGVPDPVTPTGRYDPVIWKPSLVFTGTTLDNPTTETDTADRRDQVTICTCPAPLSLGLPMEAAAGFAYIYGKIFQSTPAADAINQKLLDMPQPAPGDIPAMTDYTVRDSYAKKGCSTVDYDGSNYVIKDFRTTYNVDGEYPPFYAWVRDMNVYFNWTFRYRIKEIQECQGKILCRDQDIVTAAGIVKPKSWAAIVNALFEGAVRDALIVDADFSKNSLVVSIDTQNPNRLNTEFDLKITGIGRIISSTYRGGFNFGS